MNRWKQIISAGLLATMLSTQTAAAATAAPAGPYVQLISDQQAAGAGSAVSFSILYHSVENQNHDQAWLKVSVPQDLDADLTAMGGGQWDGESRTLKWKLKSNEGKGAQVVHFQLKVKESASLGQLQELTCTLELDGSVHTKTPKVSFKTGPQTDQPFFQGYPDGLFHPEAHLTRAEAAAIVSRVKNLTDETPLENPYADVAGDHWALGYIREVTHAGYMNGYDDGTFRPEEPITRAELVKLVLTLRGVQEVPLRGFDDTEDHWARHILGTAKELRLVDGDGRNLFRPNAPTERQAAAKLFNVALFRGPLKDGVIPVQQHFPDVSRDHWAFGWVEEASVVAHEAVHRGRGIEHLIRYLPGGTEEM